MPETDKEKIQRLEKEVKTLQDYIKHLKTAGNSLLSSAQCPKCGGEHNRYNITYFRPGILKEKDFEGRKGFEGQEGLQIHCYTCGYEWYIPTKDESKK